MPPGTGEDPKPSTGEVWGHKALQGVVRKEDWMRGMLKPLQPGSQAAEGNLGREGPGLGLGQQGRGPRQTCLGANGVPGGCV